MKTPFPEIKGITWLSDEFPDLVSIKVVMENRTIANLDIPGMKIPEMILDFYLDLTKLAGVKDWYEKGSDDPSETECCADFEGVNQMVITITKENLLKAWLFCKQYYK